MAIPRNPLKRARDLLRGRLVQRSLPNLVRDIRYGGYLGGSVFSPFRAQGMHDVESTDWADLATLFGRPSSRPRPDDVIVDVGCGKGRTLAFFHEATRGRNRVVGIEIHPAIGAATRRRFRGVGRVEVLVGDALELLPADATLLYLCNPFDEPLVRRFVALLHEKSTRLAETRIVFHHCSGFFILPFLQRGWTVEPRPRSEVRGRSVVLHAPPAA